MIRFQLTRTPHPLPALPPADDPDLPAPRPPKKLGDDGLTSGTAEHSRALAVVSPGRTQKFVCPI